MTTKTTEPNPNMKLWESWDTTPPAWTKQVKYGAREFTTTCAQKQQKLGTTELGPFGIKWRIHNSSFTPFRDAAGEIVSMLFEAEFWYILDGEEGRFDISSDMTFNKPKKDGTIGVFPGVAGEDWSKKLRTDARSKAFSLLGMCSDVFEGKFDDNKYIAEMREKFGEEPVVNPKTLAAADDLPWDEPAPPPKAPPAPKAPPVAEPVTEDQLRDIRAHMPVPFGDGTLTEERLGKTYEMYNVSDVTKLTRRQAANVLLACKKLKEEGQ